MDLSGAVNDYEASTHVLLEAARSVRQDQLDRRVPGGWSARQIIHHVADSETQSYVRLRRLIAEPEGSLVQGYDEVAWAESDALGYRDLAVEHSLAVFAAVRGASLDVLRRLSEDDLDHYGEHSESGRYTVAMWLDIYVRHPREHTEQLLEALNA
jgi:hypothetical protein